MGLWRFVKAAGAKISGPAGTAAAPPKQEKQEAGKHGLDVSQAEVKPEGDTEGGKAVLSGAVAPATADPAGVASVQDDLAAAAEAPESKFYTARSGDTLGKIAAAEYGPGNGGEYHRILAASQPLLSDPGQDLSRPSAADCSAFD